MIFLNVKKHLSPRHFVYFFVHIAKKGGLVEYQQSGFPINCSSKRRRLSSKDILDDYLSGTKMFADGACAGATSTDLAEVIVFSTEKWSCGFLHRQFEDCQDQ